MGSYFSYLVDFDGHLCMRAKRAINKADALITFDAADYQPQATDAVRQHFAEKSRKAYYAGPLMPSGAQAKEKEKINSENGGEIMAFLDEKLKSAGEHSVLYVSVPRFPIETPGLTTPPAVFRFALLAARSRQALGGTGRAHGEEYPICKSRSQMPTLIERVASAPSNLSAAS